MKTKKVSIIIGMWTFLAGIGTGLYFLSTPAYSNAQEKIMAPAAGAANVLAGTQSVQSALDFPINLEGIAAAGSAVEINGVIEFKGTDLIRSAGPILSEVAVSPGMTLNEAIQNTLGAIAQIATSFEPLGSLNGNSGGAGSGATDVTAVLSITAIDDTDVTGGLAAPSSL